MPPRRTKQELIEDEVDEIVDDDDDEDEDEDDDEETGAIFESSETIRECHWQRRTVGDLVDMMATPFLELSPDYQRDVVWSGDRMTKLINSLICNFYVPPVIFNVQKTASENGTERYKRTSVDGKQRLSSIREFVNGNIPCTDKNGRKWFFANNGESPRMNKRILNDKFKRRFLLLELLCAEYSDLERKQEEDLFSRVQLGVPLTPAEKLRASSGAWQAFAIDIEKQYAELMLTVDNKRGRSFQLVLQIFKQVLNTDDQYNPKYASGATALKSFCERPQLLDESFKATARRIFHTYNEVLKKHPETFENHAYNHATRYSPIEFVGTAVLINQYPQRNNPSLLSGDILRMRAYLREHRQDLRSNITTWKCVIEYINELEGYRGGMNVTPQGRTQGVDMSMDDAGGGSSQFLPAPAHKPPPVQLETQPPTARTKGVAAIRAASASTSLFLSPVPPISQSPPNPEMMNVRTGHLRFQSSREQQQRPALPVSSAVQQYPLHAPLAQRQPPTAPASQRQSSPNSQLRAPVAPLGQTPARSVADRFRAVSSTQSPISVPLFNSGVGSRTGSDNDVGGKRGSVDGGYSGRNDYPPRDGNYSGGQRSNKRNRMEYEHIKREKGSHFE